MFAVVLPHDGPEEHTVQEHMMTSLLLKLCGLYWVVLRPSKGTMIYLSLLAQQVY